MGRNKFQSLSESFPEIAAEADGWDPTLISSGSGKKLSWICKRGHEWEARVYSRVKGNRCPICANKILLIGFNDLKTTHPEISKDAFDWDPSKTITGTNKKLTWKCHICGHKWTTSANQRTSQGRGCPKCTHQVVDIGNNDILTLFPEIAKEAYGWDPSKVFAHSGKVLDWKCTAFGHIYKSRVANKTGLNRGCPICSGKTLLSGFNDIATTHPELAKEALDWDPSLYGRSSRKIVKWKCSEFNHIFTSQIANRANRDGGCPVCSGKKVLVGFNDLKTLRKDLAAEAFEWDPSSATISSGIKRKWRCLEGHIWSASPANRNLGTGCPKCSKYGFNPGLKGFLYFLFHFQWDMYQIGITNSPEDRLARHRRKGWELIELRGPMDGLLTQQWETAILRMLKAKGADLANSKIAGKFDGYSEAWSKSKFQVETIKQLMELTEEYEKLILKN